jgi:MFS family permease
MLTELVSPQRYALYAAAAVCIVALANMIGPVFGGLITAKAGWRWVFFLK